MPEVYSQTLDVRGSQGRDLQQDFLATLKEWVHDKWPKDEPWFHPDTPRRFAIEDGSIFRWEPFADNDEALYEFTWRHPHTSDPSITWATQISLVQVSDAAQMAVRVWNTGPEPRMDGYLPTSRPRFLIGLAKRFDCRLHRGALSASPRILDGDQLRTLVRYELLDPHRKMPIMVVSPRDDGGYAIDPVRLAEDFLSLAELVVVEDPAATFELTGELGDKALSCFNGAVRLYMPGFSKQDDPFKHPLLLQHRLRDRSLLRHYAESLARFTVSIAKPLKDVQRLRDVRAVAYEARQLELAEKFKRAQEGGAAVDEWRQLAETYSEDNERLAAEVERLREEVAELSNIVRGLRYSLARTTAAKSDSPEDAVDFQPQSVFEAVEFSQAAFDEDLRILDSALQAARQSNYRDPAEVFRALRFLAEVSKRRRNGPLGRNLKAVFLKQGIQYRQGISKSSSTTIRQQHEFSDGDQVFVCEEHLNFGTSYDPVGCARIYFTCDAEDEERIVVGHVGRHLDTPRTN